MAAQNLVDLLSRGSKSAPASLGVTNAAQLALAANPNRKTGFFVNNSVNTIFLGRDNTVTTANGVPVAAGASFKDDFSSDAWWAIAGVAGPSTLAIIETS